jgi:WS/DGAT/MGAT family acyltransferase
MERLSPLSAAFLQSEDVNPATTMAIASTAVFAGPAPTHDEFVAHITGRLPLVPRYRQKVRQIPLDLAAPVWVDDPDTDVGWHVRRTALPAPGGPAELQRLVARVMSHRMDRNRPLWEYWVVEGLADGRWAVIQKFHHCMVDGVSGTELYHVVFDPDPTPRPPVADDWVPEPAPSTLTLTARAMLDLALTPWVGLQAAGSLLRSPHTLASRAVQTARGALSMSTAALPLTSSSLSGPMGRQRRYTSLTVGFGDFRVVRKAFAGTVNDVALAAISGGFRALLLSRGETPDEHAVRTLVPVSVRMPGEEAIQDNRVSLLLPYLPVDVADPVERLATVRRRIADASASGQSVAGSSFNSILQHEPFPSVALGMRLSFLARQRQLVTVTTNVPGPRQPVYALGRLCERITPYVPIGDGMRIGVAIFSYADEMSFGITGDYDSARDIDVLADGIRDSLAELVRAAEPAKVVKRRRRAATMTPRRRPDLVTGGLMTIDGG